MKKKDDHENIRKGKILKPVRPETLIDKQQFFVLKADCSENEKNVNPSNTSDVLQVKTNKVSKLR